MDTVTAFHASTLDKHSKASLADKVCNSVSQRAIDQWVADKEKKKLYARPELSSARVTGTPTPGRASSPTRRWSLPGTGAKTLQPQPEAGSGNGSGSELDGADAMDVDHGLVHAANLAEIARLRGLLEAAKTDRTTRGTQTDHGDAMVLNAGTQTDHGDPLVLNAGIIAGRSPPGLRGPDEHTATGMVPQRRRSKVTTPI